MDSAYCFNVIKFCVGMIASKAGKFSVNTKETGGLKIHRALDVNDFALRANNDWGKGMSSRGSRMKTYIEPSGFFTKRRKESVSKRAKCGALREIIKV